MLFRFVAGNNLSKAILTGNNYLSKNVSPIINYISENTNNQNNNYEEYLNLINKLNQNFMVALKLSSLNFEKKNIENIADRCREKKIKLIIDAENNKNIENYRNIANSLVNKYNKNELNIIKTYQMYRKDSILELYDDITLYDIKDYKFSAKLVRGAYWNEERNENNLFKKKEDTDINYNLALLRCYESKHNNHILATHNSFSINTVLNLDKNKKKFIIANLMGMNENFMKNINHNKAIYIPYGPYKEMIPYLSRRLYENIDQIKNIYK
jgi:proline dehydrogenase